MHARDAQVGKDGPGGGSEGAVETENQINKLCLTVWWQESLGPNRWKTLVMESLYQ